MTGRTRGVARLAAAGAVVLAWSIWSSPAAAAHASLESADPAPGTTLDTSPETITLTFTEPPDPDLTTVELLDVAGSTVPTSRPELAGARTVRVAIPDPLPDGTYTVSWRVVSTVDGHLTAGTVPFGVGVAPEEDVAVPQDEPAGPTALSVVAKSCLYAGLMVLIAVAVVGLGAFSRRPRTLPVVALTGAVLALGGVAGLLASERAAVDVPMGDLLASETGRPLVWLAVAVLVADAFAVIAAAKDAWRPLLWGAGAAAAAATFIRADGGHAAAGSPATLHVALQGIHGVAAGVWIGGLVLLLLLLRERPSEPATGPPVREVRRYSNVAVVAAVVVVLTGIVRAVEVLGGVGAISDALGTSYGRILSLKVLAVLALIAMGAVNRRRSIPRLVTDPGALARIVRAEAIVALGVVVLTATLTGTAPPAEEAPAGAGPAEEPVTASGTDFATTTRVDLVVTPGTPGPSTFEALVTDPDLGTPLAAAEVDLRLRSVTRPDTPPGTIPLALQGSRWTATSSALSFAGTWSATAVVRTGADATEVPLVLITRSPDATATVEVGPGLPTVTTTTFPDGSSIQTYVDPATAGPNQVHVTAFAAEGTERPLTDVAIVAVPQGDEPRRLEVVSFGPGHVVANADLGSGDWTFDVVATAEDGSVMQATFDATVEDA